MTTTIDFPDLDAAALWAGLIEAEPPATAAERRFWPADVVEDNGEYNGEYDD